MFRNYLLAALRHHTREKLYAFINLAGLAVGLACTILIVLFIRDELSYDKWIPGSAHLYRVEMTWRVPGRPPLRFARCAFPIPKAMFEHISLVKAMTHLTPANMTVTVADRHFHEVVDIVDPNFFQVIRLRLIEGDPKTVISQPDSVVLSQSIARKFFGNADPVGKTVNLSENRCDSTQSANCRTEVYNLTVTGVLRDLPHNTQLIADIVLPNTSKANPMPQAVKEAWDDAPGYGYIELARNANPGQVLAQTSPIIDSNVNVMKELGWKLRGSQVEEVDLTPFQEVHLSSDEYGGMTAPGSWTTVYGFAAIAALILLVACFNFMNLATARATQREREISLRKIVGATRRQVIVQFLGEALLTALLAFVLAMVLVEIVLPAYDRLLDRSITFHYLAEWRVLLGFIAIAAGAGLLSGAYPALVLSGFRPVVTLRTSGATRSRALRTSLVVAQFAVSIGLGIAALVVFEQIAYARHANLGFNRSGVVVISGGGSLTASARQSFANALTTSPAIVRVAQSNIVPFDGNFVDGKVQAPGGAETFLVHVMDISPNFPQTYDMRLLAGRQLSEARGEDRLPFNIFDPSVTAASMRNSPDEGRNVLINGAAARRLGWSAAEAVGRTIAFDNIHVKVAGVLDDPKIDGLKEAVQPTVYVYSPDGNTTLSVRVRGGDASEALPFIDRTWRSFMSAAPVQRYFLSDAFDASFKGEEKQGYIFSLFVGIAIFISCLGLFGLAAFTVQRSTKEIGIRKISGAGMGDIVRMLLWQFSTPVLVANAIAWPITFYYLRHWLQGYAYHISLSPLYFVAAGLVALVIAWLTVLAHALRVARVKPVQTLRYE